MKTKLKEKQSFNDRLVYILLIGAMAILTLGLVYNALQGQLNWYQALGFIFVISFFGAYYWYLKQLQLKVSVNEKNIKFKLKPFHDKSQKIEWDEVESCKIIESPRKELWHGGNISFCREHWYSVTGRNGLSIKTKDGKRYMIGFSNTDKLAHYLKNLSLA